MFAVAFPFSYRTTRVNKKGTQTCHHFAGLSAWNTFYVLRWTFSEGVLGAMPGVYRATDTVMPRLSGSIHASNEQCGDAALGRHRFHRCRRCHRYDCCFRGGGIGVGAFGPRSCRISTSHISLDGAYTPCADGLLQTCKPYSDSGNVRITPW